MASRTLGAAETGGGMDYRLFLMADGHVRRAREFVMADDAEAIVHADRLREGEAAELWRRAVRIRSFAKDPPGHGADRSR